MPTLDVKIPPMGESIASGILAKWYVKDGETVKKDQPLFELETDKITTESTAEATGRISLRVATGAEVKIGQIIAQIDTAAGAPATPPTGLPPVPAGLPPPLAIARNDAQSPAVRRLAAETGVNPATVAGTGREGLVTKGDMLSATAASAPVTSGPPPARPAAPAGPPPAEPAARTSPTAAPTRPPVPTLELKRTGHTMPPMAPAAPAPVAELEKQTRRKLTPLRQKIAERLVAAQHEAAMLTTFNEVDMSAVMALRAKYQDDFVKKNGFKLGFMSFFVQAAVHALRAVPAVNAQLDGDTVIENHYYDIGVAVSTERGLMVPVIRGCDSLGMAGIEKAIGDVAGRARDGKITLADLDGGVFTITNGGIFGSLLSTPIINPPQSAILGMHSIQDRPVAVGGQVVIRPMMYVALSYDHRLVDGREAVTFLMKVKQAIEDPARLLLNV